MDLKQKRDLKIVLINLYGTQLRRWRAKLVSEGLKKSFSKNLSLFESWMMPFEVDFLNNVIIHSEVFEAKFFKSKLPNSIYSKLIRSTRFPLPNLAIHPLNFP